MRGFLYKLLEIIVVLGIVFYIGYYDVLAIVGTKLGFFLNKSKSNVQMH